MNEDYLWDRTGEADAEIARLESLLGQYRWKRQNFKAPRSGRSRFFIPASMAAAAILGAWVWQAHRVTSWSVVSGHAAPRALRTGELLVTGPFLGAKISSDAVGEVDIDPGSRLRMSASRQKLERFNLERGVIHARIWAPPTEFVVDTPSAEAVDLGCSYTLEVEPDGSGRVVVETGWVAFKWRERESFIPAGASCVMRKERGPGTPYFSDAPAMLRQAVTRFDGDGSESSLEAALRSARTHDALTLWHLLRRTDGGRRVQVFQRFASLTGFPYEANEAAILRDEPAAFDAAWNAMDLGNASFWREWEQRMP